MDGEDIITSTLYKDRKEWADVTPLYCVGNEDCIVRIAYTDEFKDAFAYLRAVMNSGELTARCFELTTTCVTQYRREIIAALGLDLQKEMRFISEMIMENPKNYQVWHHRGCLVEILNKDFEEELDFTAEVLEDEPKNYHAWQHRLWVIREYKLANQTELDYSTRLIIEDPYNNSAWHYRHVVLALMGKLQDPITIDIEENFCKEVAQNVQNNESVWSYLTGLLAENGLLSRPGLEDWAQQLWDTAEEEKRSYMVGQFLLDIQFEYIDKNPEEALKHVERVKQLCAALGELDGVRRFYYAHLQALAENTYHKCAGAR
ncbi:unnamed protein product, partial [Mesorhabditis spiculigera]